jgi:hypothetical protein
VPKGRSTAAREPVPNDVAVRRAIVECHEDLRNLLRRRLGDSQTAEDVLHDAVLRAIERAGQLRESESGNKKHVGSIIGFDVYASWRASPSCTLPPGRSPIWRVYVLGVQRPAAS